MQGFLLNQYVQCQRCETKKPLMEMSQFSYRGKVTYECPNRTNCFTKEELKAKADKERDKELLAKFGTLPQEEQIEAMYGVKFDDLEELSIRLRDGSCHYHHIPTGEYYSWDLFQHTWKTANSSIKKYIQQD
ncbi:hypothetical protein Klosneuvirus_3_24 [Klosneuvirus KNV1]|uniref:Uncharacterized protein n=1 Tax=Klosneuvirus KNV1 TaxID=1977640 RepID=A0A1V0SJJ6_9VIRU|nr:hypothetical protein Klosneuvirus_3_24 [Klosneuvirus KNV1]